MLQRTVFVNKIRMLQRAQMLQRTPWNTIGRRSTRVRTSCRVFPPGMLQRTVFVNKIRMLQRTQMLQRTRRNTIGRRSRRVRTSCRVFPLWLEPQSSSLVLFVRFSLVQLPAYLRL